MQRNTLIILVCTAIAVVSFGCTLGQATRRPSRYLIPDGYVGWVQVKFDVSGQPSLPVEEDHYLIVFPPSGILTTSSGIEYGWAKDQYYYYLDGKRQELLQTTYGKGGLIWGGSTGWSGKNYDERTDVVEEFFVGTEDEFRRFGSEKDLSRKIGNIKKYSE